MGGICGIYCNFLSSEIVTTYRMVESMQHRGYDNVGFYTDDYVVLAHNDSKKYRNIKPNSRCSAVVNAM